MMSKCDYTVVERIEHCMNLIYEYYDRDSDKAINWLYGHNFALDGVPIDLLFSDIDKVFGYLKVKLGNKT